MMLRGQDVKGEPLERRRQLLHEKLFPKLKEPVRFSPELCASVPDLLKSVKAQNLEGFVARRRDSRYEPGQRSGAWQKMRVNPEKSPDLQRLADQSIEGLTPCVLDKEHRLAALAYELQRPQCRRTVQALPKFEFVCEAIDVLKDRKLPSLGKNGHERVFRALRVISPQSAEEASGVPP